jgi:hypothetical protein
MSQLEEIANLAEQYKQQYETGQLSGEDYKELINNLNIMGHINSAADDLTQNQQAYKILMGAIQLAGAIY